MSEKAISRKWSSKYLFLMASIGSTVGLSNIWKFTYLVGENGGGAFVIVYLCSLMSIGVPVLMAELMIGRMGGRSIVGTMHVLADKEGISPQWKYFGWVALFALFLILSFYCVIAGWTIDYSVASMAGALDNLGSQTAVDFYNTLMGSPFRMALSQGVFIAITVWIVAGGIHGGLEKSIRWMMPALFFILIVVMVYAMITGEIQSTLRFMFAPDFSKITATVALTAFGQAFFSLGVGLGVMLTYGAYMPHATSIFSSAVLISFTDGLVAVMAGLAIFPIVFQYGLSPAEGPGLLFMTLPIAFGKMMGGGFIGTLFFLLLFFAALTSSISLLEAIVSRLEEMSRLERKTITVITGALLWVVGLGTVFSFNIWSDFTPLDIFTPWKSKTIFGLIDYFASNIIMPVGGILMAVIAGWLIPRGSSYRELKLENNFLYALWRFLVRYVAPAVVLFIFISNLN